MSPTRSIQVYLCNGGGALSEPVDFERLTAVARALPAVRGVDAVSAACTELNGELTASLTSGEAEGVVVIGCSEEKLLRHLHSLVERAGGSTDVPLVTADLKWSCRGDASVGVATAKAESLLRQAVARASLSSSLWAEPTKTEAGVIVFGEGHAALRVVSELSGAGFPVTLVTHTATIDHPSLDASRTTLEQACLDDLLYAALENDSVEVLTETTLASCSGSAGSFSVQLRKGRTGKVFLRQAGALVIATEPILESRIAEYGLPEGSPAVFNQQELEDALSALSMGPLCGQRPNPLLLGDLSETRVLITVGAHEDTSVLASERALRLALKVVERGATVDLITRNLKVAAEGVERLAQQCRSQGVTIHKVIHGTTPTFSPRGEKIHCHFTSAALSQAVELEADLVVADERFSPSPALEAIVRALRLETGPEGFLQPENVHLTPVLTNHQAVLAVGPARGRCDVVSGLDDAAAAAMAVRQLITHETKQQSLRAFVDTAACAACLTCLRVCPHGAISFKDRPVIAAQFCEGCGQCASECPMDAITIVACSDERIQGEVTAAFTTERPDLEVPLFVVLACQRSAMEAIRLAGEYGEELPTGMVVIELPCAGRVDELHLLKAFEVGADGVAVLACHDGNCRSLHGQELAKERLLRLGGRLTELGLEPERLLLDTIASNMGVELAQQLRRFEETLRGLGPSPLRRARLTEPRERHLVEGE